MRRISSVFGHPLCALRWNGVPVSKIVALTSLALVVLAACDAMPSPASTATLTPLACGDASRVVVSEVAGQVFASNFANISGRITNTCNRSVAVRFTVIMYSSEGSILGSKREYTASPLVLSPGLSQVITSNINQPGLYDPNYQPATNVARFAIELEVVRID